MKVLMLGWEYPPHISGGLGTACEGLTVALSKLNIAVDFVVPHLTGDERAPHMTLLDPDCSEGEAAVVEPCVRGAIETHPVEAALSPYWSEGDYDRYLAALDLLRSHGGDTAELLPEDIKALFGGKVSPSLGVGSGLKKGPRYGRDIFGEVSRYASSVVALMAGRSFDVIHAHDWMTFPAGVALSRLTGKPLIAHVHSLEYDRSGRSVNPKIDEIERMGLEAANVVIAVSYYTRSVINQQHGIPVDKLSIVHNGVYPREAVNRYRREGQFASKTVLFLGRITFQKGPEYFVEAAAKVLPHVSDVTFVMAGTGDMLPKVVARVKELGLEKHFRFPGFLKGEEVEQMFSTADLYVMPSVSEPFGISALEAISFDTPVVISWQSGVAEVLNHALKVDFWDVDRLADLIINGLLHPELRDEMVEMAREEVKRLRWDAAALKTAEIYRRLM